jgi:hypothetical protein
MLLRYQKVIDQYTTYTLKEPDYSEDSNLKCTELCTLNENGNNYTYVHVPDEIDLPDQPKQIVLEEVILDQILLDQIKKASPHVQLSYKRLQDRIRSKYSIDDEQYFTRISIGVLNGTYEMHPDEPALIAEYQTWVEESREIARLERVGWELELI